MTNKEEYRKLLDLLIKLQRNQICWNNGNGWKCPGYQNCSYGVNGCYGEFCSIENIIENIENEMK